MTGAWRFKTQNFKLTTDVIPNPALLQVRDLRFFSLYLFEYNFIEATKKN
jgi:hypothetical protein